MLEAISNLLQLVSRYSLGAVLLLAASGCEPTEETATLTGKVTLDGKPLTQGSVLFAPSGGEKRNAAAGDIKSDGSYTVQIGQTEKLIVGEYVVEVVSREPSSPHPDGGPPIPGAFITPLKYGKAETSGLRYNVRRGENIIDIVLVSAAQASHEEDNASLVEEAKPENAVEAPVPSAEASQSTEPIADAVHPTAETSTSQ